MTRRDMAEPTAPAIITPRVPRAEAYIMEQQKLLRYGIVAGA
jgi:hypothetical protein